MGAKLYRKFPTLQSSHTIETKIEKFPKLISRLMNTFKEAVQKEISPEI